MQKLFLFLLVLVAIYYFRRVFNGGRKNARVPPQSRTPPVPPEAVRECRACGLHVPQSEGIEVNGEFYCSVEHAHGANRDGVT